LLCCFFVKHRRSIHAVFQKFLLESAHEYCVLILKVLRRLQNAQSMQQVAIFAGDGGRTSMTQ
jgi:hypothetical protein